MLLEHATRKLSLIKGIRKGLPEKTGRMSRSQSLTEEWKGPPLLAIAYQVGNPQHDARLT